MCDHSCDYTRTGVEHWWRNRDGVRADESREKDPSDVVRGTDEENPSHRSG